MNAITKIRPAPKAELTPAAAQRRDHEIALSELDHEARTLHKRVEQTKVTLADAEAPAAALAALRERQAAAIAARLIGDKPTEDEAALEVEIAEQVVVVAAQAPVVKGAGVALDRLYAQLADVAARRATDLRKRRDLQLAEIDERLAHQAKVGESVAGPFVDWLAETHALALIRDRLRRPGEDMSARGMSHRFQLPAPALAIFDAFGATRDIGARVEGRGAEVMAELGITLNSRGEPV